MVCSQGISKTLAAFFLICAWNNPNVNRTFDRALQGMKFSLQTSVKREVLDSDGEVCSQARCPSNSREAGSHAHIMSTGSVASILRAPPQTPASVIHPTA